MSGSRRRDALLRPARAVLVDAAFAVVLTGLAIGTLHDTFSGWQYLVVGVVGALLGAVVAHACSAVRAPWVVVPPALVAAYLLFGGALALRADPDATWAPTPGTWGELVRVGVRGWAQLLTTLPPVDGDGPLLALVLLLGLVGGGLGLAVAGRVRASGAPLVVVVATLVLAVLIGTADPGTLRLVGIGTGLGGLAWAGLRSRRRLVSTATGRSARAVTALVILAVAGAVVAVAAPALPGTGPSGRTILRSKVTPPLDLSAFPSPLAGFRRFTPPAQQLAQRTLFTVHGLPAGTRVRIATLDSYDGLVWGVRNDAAAPAVGRAVDTFQRIGTSVASPVSGRTARLQVRIGAAYAAAADTSGWLPDAGALTSVTFGGRHADGHRSSVRYNLATGTAVVPDRLRAGDTYTVHAVLNAATRDDATVPTDASPGGTPSLDPGRFAFVAPALARLTAQQTGGRWAQLRTVARVLRTEGAYTDGGTGETQFLPGHSTGRLRRFLAATQYAGNDEQYAALYALMANSLGFPARVVVGATPTSDVVRGKDVHAWVELLLSGRGWVTVPTGEFTPPTTQRPRAQQVEQPDDTSAAVVPPPNAVRPPSSLDQLTQSGSNASRRGQGGATDDAGWELPGFVVVALKYGGPPVALVVLVVGAITAVKALRRRRRRTTGSNGVRLAAGWRELLDQARDLGATVTGDLTRREQARVLEAYGLLPLAERADRVLFGEYPPTEANSLDYWADVGRVRREMLLGVDRRQRWRARVSLRSLRELPRPSAGQA